MARYNEELGHSDKAFAIYEEIVRNYPNDYHAVLEMMIHFSKDKNSEDNLTGLDRRTQAFHEHHANEEYHQAIMALVSDNKTFDAIFESYQAAIVAAKERLAKATNESDTEEEIFHRTCQEVLMHNLAHLCRECREKGIYHRPMVTKGLVCAQHANGCFHKVLRDDSTAPTYLEQLDQLAAFKPIYVDNEERLATYPKEFIARFHAPQGDEQEVKDTLRTYIKRNIDILFGDDPLNGWQGYQGLAIYLMFAGQNADCLVAWLLIVSYDGM
ncbi:Tetratricopeptide-like helical [Penicillium hordei]|uniref:Tetratricopeptide-like helical n=1 Tax=Penicillium hordei TaxID=40994 RepID=A0AAD6GSA1_9EURO|nr:Tetratricopeptide-like helical [Penicillium hordei]KAJ5588253.1 Tetratricopeptide-like helical [Penicillium hordei]